ncbi:MBL fold metallo-hydrolase [Shewanella woodyi]|uniref:MBL fold metallo-hydrolase n=1 Tax=Shewanella woodyi TaxID=60961 RepID=UPI0037493DEC
MNKAGLSFITLMAMMFSANLFASNLPVGQCSGMQIQTLGAGGPEINDGLASTSFLVWINGKARVMVDAGGGSSLNFEQSTANFNDLQAVLLTHLHVDHSAALPVYVKAGFFTERDTPLGVFGPNSAANFPSTTEFVSALFNDTQKSAFPYLSDNVRQQASTDYLVKTHNVAPENKVWQQALTDDLSISAINVLHGPVPALAWRVSLGECSVTFSGDMNGRSGNLPVLAKGSQLLVMNNAIGQEAGRIEKSLHMTPQIIGEIAQEAQVNQLMLAHFMLRSTKALDESLTIIKADFTGKVILANELESIQVK